MALVYMDNTGVHTFATARLRQSMYMHVMGNLSGVARNICASEALGRMRTHTCLLYTSDAADE